MILINNVSLGDRDKFVICKTRRRFPFSSLYKMWWTDYIHLPLVLLKKLCSVCEYRCFHQKSICLEERYFSSWVLNNDMLHKWQHQIVLHSLCTVSCCYLFWIRFICVMKGVVMYFRDLSFPEACRHLLHNVIRNYSM